MNAAQIHRLRQELARVGGNPAFARDANPERAAAIRASLLELDPIGFAHMKEAPLRIVITEPSNGLGYDWTAYRGDQVVCSGEGAATKEEAHRDAVEAAEFCEAPAEGSAA